MKLNLAEDFGMAISNTWHSVPLGEIADVLCGGTPSTSIPEYWDPPQIDWVTAKDISECQLAKIHDTERRISQEGLENSSAKMLPALTTVIIARGATMGKCRMIGHPMALNQTCYGIVAGAGTDPVYLYYHLSNLYNHFRNMAHGSVFDTVIGSGLRSLSLSVPPLHTQRRIANILGALDDKIEVNRRINRTLEAMAQALYKHWFVDFGPFQDGEFVESELGEIPKGWRLGTIGEVVEIHDNLRVPLSKMERAKRKGPYRYYGATGVIDYIDDFIFDGVYALIGEDGSVIKPDNTPFVQYVFGQFWVNNHAHVLQGKNGISTEHLKVFLEQVNLRPFVTGAVQAKLSQTNLKKIPFVIAPHNINNAFDAWLQPLYAMIRSAQLENQALTATRDYLLPKLLSREIPVDTAEESVGGAVQGLA